MEKIVSKRTTDGVVSYEIKWKDYQDTENTFEPLENLSQAKEAIAEFENAQRQQRFARRTNDATENTAIPMDVDNSDHESSDVDVDSNGEDDDETFQEDDN